MLAPWHISYLFDGVACLFRGLSKLLKIPLLPPLRSRTVCMHNEPARTIADRPPPLGRLWLDYYYRLYQNGNTR